jgi:hypothetical protein
MKRETNSCKLPQECNASIGLFFRGQQSTRLDIPGKIAAYFGPQAITVKKNPRRWGVPDVSSARHGFAPGSSRAGPKQ